MHRKNCLLGSLLLVVAACTTVGASLDTVTLSGRVTDRREVAAAAKYDVSPDFIFATMGAVGLLFAQIQGTPKHYVYTVETSNGTEYSVPVKTDVAVGPCLSFSIPISKADQLSWQLDEVRIENGSKCLPILDSVYEPMLDRKVDENGNNALQLAIWYGQNKRAMRILKEKSVDLNAVNKFGATALHLAVAKEDAKMVKALIDAGANPDIRNSEGATPAVEAERNASGEILDLLERAGMNQPPPPGSNPATRQAVQAGEFNRLP